MERRTIFLCIIHPMAIGKCGEPGIAPIVLHHGAGSADFRADFGVMSIALVVVGFVEIFAQIGIGPSSYSADLSPGTSEQPCSSRWLGAAFFALMYGTAPQIGVWFNSDALAEVLRWVAFSLSCRASLWSR